MATTQAEDALYYALTDIGSLDVLVRKNLPLKCVPNEKMREVVAWSIAYYYEAGRLQAPTREALLETWGQHIEDADVELVDEDFETDTIEWAIDSLKDQMVTYEFQTFLREAATNVSTSMPLERLETMRASLAQGFELVLDLEDRSARTKASEGYLDSLNAYQRRAEAPDEIEGMTFGIDEIDSHLRGIRDGDLAILAAGPKVGKSAALTKFALHEWRDLGKKVALFTLENSVELTLDRLACLHLGINFEHWDRGLVDADQLAQVETFIKEELPGRPGELYILRPDVGQRTPGQIVREAKNLDVDSIYIDQLTFLEHPSPSRKARHEIVADVLRMLKNEISGRDAIPCLLAHQINRDGVKAAEKMGHLAMYHLAESAEAERVADWVFGVHQGADDKIAQRALFQMLASRRKQTKNWEVSFRFEASQIRVIRERSLDG